ncbi:ferric reductase like transmembrane component-domain-containing protein [Podospora conica]|nr:ferric reductase like transmembrane component-domain-containing protein [Schizothecium conicum]
MAIMAALLATLLLAGTTAADGRGLIGFGRNMYYPLCAASCRGALEGAALVCTPHGSVDTGSHSHGATPPDCYASDTAFMQTLAFCMSTRCDRAELGADVLETYWTLHLVGGARINLDPRPSKGYYETLETIKEAPTVEYVAGEMLNVTSLVPDSTYESQFIALGVFETAETGHSRYSLVVLLTGFLIPIAASALRFLPFPARLRTRLAASFNHPAVFGSRHRTPVGAGIVPTRGQALFIGYLVLINILVCVVDIRPGPQPNAWFESDWHSIMTYLSDRAGTLCFANICLLLLFSARNNFLLLITDWSHSTFLLLHRWIGYIAIIQAAVHCVMWIHWFRLLGTHNAEAAKPYWYWGIIAMLALALLYPLSLLPVRKRLYEFFLLSHIALTVLVLVGNYQHVYLLYANHWGYEIWIYTAVAVWGGDRVLRVWRALRHGVTLRADITRIDDDYLRVDIEGVVAPGAGHAYLYFPTLRPWSPWENHPFSVASSFAGGHRPPTTPSLHSAAEEETKSPMTASASPVGAAVPRPRLTFVIRVQKGITAALATRAGTSVPVLVETGYHSPPQTARLARCTTLVCIAGGVGITTMIPLLKTHPGARARLYWGMRNASLRDALAEEMGGLDVVQCEVGKRLDVKGILEEELLRGDEKGEVGVVVSGPAGMADEVRDVLCRIGASGRAARGVVFLDEAFSW